MENESGVVTWFSPTKGCGFIRRDNHAGELFAHVSQVEGGKILAHDQRVTYRVDVSRQGRIAADIRPLQG